MWIARLLLERVGGEWQIEAAHGDQPGLFLPGGVSVEMGVLQASFQRATLGLEADTGARDRHGRFDESAIAWDVRRPVVDDAAAALAARLAEAGVAVPARVPSLRVVLTHDVDWVTPREPVSMAKSLVQATRRPGRWLSLAQAVSGDAFLRAVDRLLELEQEVNARSWFFMLAGPYRPSRWGSRYDCRWGTARRLARAVQAAGCQVGLHGSYEASEAHSYRREVNRLAEVLGERVRLHRSHYLRFDRNGLWSDLEEAGIEVDSSVGLVSGMGFRAGLATPYRPFLPSAARAARVLELPLVYMDGAEDLNDADRRMTELGETLATVRSAGGWVALLLHPESIAVDLRWVDFYRRVLALCRELGADLSGAVPFAEPSGNDATIG
jgi:hypothetical protein